MLEGGEKCQLGLNRDVRVTGGIKGQMLVGDVRRGKDAHLTLFFFTNIN